MYYFARPPPSPPFAQNAPRVAVQFPAHLDTNCRESLNFAQTASECGNNRVLRKAVFSRGSLTSDCDLAGRVAQERPHTRLGQGHHPLPNGLYSPAVSTHASPIEDRCAGHDQFGIRHRHRRDAEPHTQPTGAGHIPKQQAECPSRSRCRPDFFSAVRTRGECELRVPSPMRW